MAIPHTTVRNFEAAPAEFQESMDTFALRLDAACDTHEQWLSLIRFGMPTLLADQSLMIELIVRESARQRERRGIEYRTVADEASNIIKELGLKFAVC